MIKLSIPSIMGKIVIGYYSNAPMILIKIKILKPKPSLNPIYISRSSFDLRKGYTL